MGGIRTGIRIAPNVMATLTEQNDVRLMIFRDWVRAGKNLQPDFHVAELFQ